MTPVQSHLFVAIAAIKTVLRQTQGGRLKCPRLACNRPKDKSRVPVGTSLGMFQNIGTDGRSPARIKGSQILKLSSVSLTWSQQTHWLKLKMFSLPAKTCAVWLYMCAHACASTNQFHFLWSCMNHNHRWYGMLHSPWSIWSEELPIPTLKEKLKICSLLIKVFKRK